MAPLGWFWPNTYYVKSAHRGSTLHQLTSVATGLLPVVAVTVLVVAAGRLLTGRAAHRQRDRRAARQDATPVVLAVIAAVIVLFLYKQSDLGMNFADRFPWQALFPVLAVVLARPIGLLNGQGRSLRDGWALTAIGIAAGTAVAFAPSTSLAHVATAAAVVVVALAAVARLITRKPEATVLAAVGLAVLLAWVSVPEMVGWAAYRYRLQGAHEAVGHVIQASGVKGAVAIGDAGILPFELRHQQVIDVNALANSAIAHGTFSDADLQRADLQLVVALSTQPNATSAWSPTLGQIVTYAYARKHFWFTQGPAFAGSYWLNFWVDPAIAKQPLLGRLQALTDRSQQEATKDDTSVLGDHLFDFPFLAGN